MRRTCIHAVSPVCAGVLLDVTSVTDPDTTFWAMLVNAMALCRLLRYRTASLDPVLPRPGLTRRPLSHPFAFFVRWGSIVAMWAVSLLHLELSNEPYIASGASLLLSAYALTLPKIPVAEKKTDHIVCQQAGSGCLRAVSLIYAWPLFFLFAMMLGAEITNVFGNPFLHDFARNPEFADSFVVKYPSILLSVSQMAEVLFTLTIPFFLKRSGIKTVTPTSMAARHPPPGFFSPPTGLFVNNRIYFACCCR
ncbi:hypothetical protein ACLK2F_13600 [Escherichia coli]